MLARGWFEQVDDRPQRQLARLRPDGSPDPDFVSPPENAVLLGLTQSPGGAILWMRRYDEQLGAEAQIVQRLQPNGEADPAFTP